MTNAKASRVHSTTNSISNDRSSLEPFERNSTIANVLCSNFLRRDSLKEEKKKKIEFWLGIDVTVATVVQIGTRQIEGDARGGVTVAALRETSASTSTSAMRPAADTRETRTRRAAGRRFAVRRTTRSRNFRRRRRCIQIDSTAVEKIVEQTLFVF